MRPLHRLDDRTPRLERPVRAGVAEAAVRHVDDVGPELLQPLVAEAEPLHHAGGEVLGDGVRDAHQLGQQLLAPLGAQVQRDAELLDVVVVEAGAAVGAAVAVEVRAELAHDVPQALGDRVLDADHLRAERREHARRAGAGQLAGQVADADVAQRAVVARTRSPRGLATVGSPIGGSSDRARGPSPSGPVPAERTAAVGRSRSVDRLGQALGPNRSTRICSTGTPAPTSRSLAASANPGEPHT